MDHPREQAETADLNRRPEQHEHDLLHWRISARAMKKRPVSGPLIHGRTDSDDRLPVDRRSAIAGRPHVPAATARTVIAAARAAE